MAVPTERCERSIPALKMSSHGRVLVPPEIREALGLKEGDEVFWELGEGEARLVPRRERLREDVTLG